MKKERRKRKNSEDKIQQEVKEGQSSVENKEVKTEEQKKQEKDLSLAIKLIEKKFGKGTIKKGSDECLTINRLSTGIKSFDEALGGGIPIGMILELYGEESGGKSTIILKAIAKVQRDGYVCAYLDSEKAYDKAWAKKLGVDIDALIYVPLTDADNVFDVAKELIKSRGVKIIVVDSVAALTPRKEIENDMEKLGMGTVAKIVNKGLRVLNTLNERQGVSIIFINQLRSRIGIMYGNPDTTPGGRGMKFFAAIRINIRRGEWFPNRKDRIGFEIVCRIEKNKTAQPYKEARVVLINKTGKILEWDKAKELAKELKKDKEAKEEKVEA